MSKIAIIYWTGTGNTLEMARAIEKGAKDAGATVEVFEVESFGGVDRLKEYDGLMFGCPAMGDEVLEEGAFEPFFAEAESHLQGVPVALFGSYGWGGGAWMESWAERSVQQGPSSSVTASPSRTPLTTRAQLHAKRSARSSPHLFDVDLRSMCYNRREGIMQLNAIVTTQEGVVCFFLPSMQSSRASRCRRTSRRCWTI